MHRTMHWIMTRANAGGSARLPADRVGRTITEWRTDPDRGASSRRQAPTHPPKTGAIVIGVIISAIIVGLIVGASVRLVVPGVRTSRSGSRTRHRHRRRADRRRDRPGARRRRHERHRLDQAPHPGRPRRRGRGPRVGPRSLAHPALRPASEPPVPGQREARPTLHGLIRSTRASQHDRRRGGGSRRSHRPVGVGDPPAACTGYWPVASSVLPAGRPPPLQQAGRAPPALEHPSAARRSTAMSHYKHNLRDLEFTLFEFLGRDQVLGSGPFAEVDGETAREMLAKVAPPRHRRPGPLAARQRPRPSGLRPRHAQRAPARVVPPQLPGVRRRRVLARRRPGRARRHDHPAAACAGPSPSSSWQQPGVHMYGSASRSPRSCTSSGPGPAKLAGHMVEGHWGATMVLTEPDAGSDVGAGRAGPSSRPTAPGTSPA